MTTFEEASLKAARRFLQTVVIVDNQARYGPAVSTPASGEQLEEPDEFDTVDEAAQEPAVGGG
jgi:hypothetical protein